LRHKDIRSKLEQEICDLKNGLYKLSQNSKEDLLKANNQILYLKDEHNLKSHEENSSSSELRKFIDIQKNEIEFLKAQNLGLCEDRSKLETEFNNFKKDITNNFDQSKVYNKDILNEKTRTIDIIQKDLHACQNELS
jgi:hypothetical protein